MGTPVLQVPVGTGCGLARSHRVLAVDLETVCEGGRVERVDKGSCKWLRKQELQGPVAIL